jgi:fructan beta-fructosidase
VVGVRASGPELFVDRRRSVAASTHKDYAGRHAGPVRWREDKIAVRLIFDRSVIEVFANDGETVITDRVYPSAPLDRVEWIGGVPPEGARATLSELASVWESR